MSQELYEFRVLIENDGDAKGNPRKRLTCLEADTIEHAGSPQEGLRQMAERILRGLEQGLENVIFPARTYDFLKYYENPGLRGQLVIPVPARLCKGPKVAVRDLPEGHVLQWSDVEPAKGDGDK